LLQYYPTPVQEIKDHPACVEAGIRLFLKREDLNHPTVSGNKWWKLKYNVDAALSLPHKTILTFGGAYSNHIYATAAAAREVRLKAIGIIRGEETLPLNPTLKFAAEQGMKIHYVTREAYREKSTPAFIQKLHQQFGEFLLIPEGGTNLLAVKGCAEFAEKELSKLDFDHLFLPVGTGGTMAGVICGLKAGKKIIGVSVLKDGDFLNREVEALVRGFSGKSFDNWSILTNYHAGGYAKTTPELLSFIEHMRSTHDLPLDHVYTGKLLLAVMKEIESGSFTSGSAILAIHTGGSQGSLP
jgi:1-aminocyclopropane-1-carboxylate deaminase/D-cysteine desulfhydrase-like pyridoxal-dependent ACC family enzyme